MRKITNLEGGRPLPDCSEMATTVLFACQASITHKVSVRIHIPKLPLKLCNDTFLKRIDSLLKTMLKIDKLESLHDHEWYAKIHVEAGFRETKEWGLRLRSLRDVTPLSF